MSERLTEKVDEKEHSANKYILLGVLEDITKYFQGIDKLGQLEDIEEELGIDLITLFKALKNGIYYKGVNVYGCKDKTFKEVRLNEHPVLKGKKLYIESVFGGSLVYGVWLKDYGKTWALTKKELEK